MTNPNLSDIMSDMDTTTLPELNVEIELGGSLFATVRASFVFDCIGAHVDLDGNVLGDTGLTRCVPEDLWGAKWALRNKALTAVRKAHIECGMDFAPDGPNEMAARVAISKAMPLLDAHAETTV